MHQTKNASHDAKISYVVSDEEEAGVTTSLSDTFRRAFMGIIKHGRMEKGRKT